MTDELPALGLLFVLVLALNTIPAFAPPTWMALAFVSFQDPQANPILLAVVAASAATCGRLVLARFSHWFVRGRLLGDAHRRNIDIIKARIERRRALTFGAVLLFAFGPFPSNFLFIAYGLTGLPMPRIAIPFFVGRAVSYTLFATGGGAIGRRFNVDGMAPTYYAIAYFLGSQALIMAALYLGTRIDWQTLLDDRRFAWVSTTKKTAAAGSTEVKTAGSP